MQATADVVVIGGGIVGCSAAYYLARRGLDVTLLEKGAIAGEQSRRNWGWERQNGRNVRELHLAVLSRNIWAGLADELGEDVGWVSAGNIDLVYDEAEFEMMRAWRARAIEAGLHTEILDRASVEALIPAIKDPFLGGIYSPSDGQADPHLAAPAYARAAERAGANVRPGVAVHGIEVDQGRVRGARTDDGVIAASSVVVAAGAWS